MPTTYPATFQDGSGLQRLDGSLLITGNAGVTPLNVLSFPFTFATAGLASGVTLYTPSIGDIIYDIGVVITTAFDGTTPKIDVGTFNGGNNGLFDELATAPIDATKVYADVTNNAGLGTPNSALWLSTAIVQGNSASLSSLKSNEIRVSAANPVLLVASQSGAKGGTAITSTHGVGTVYVITATFV